MAELQIKAAKATLDAAPALREMLVAVVISTNRFDVVKVETMSAGKQSQESGSGGTEQAASAADKGKEKPADLIISVAVTEFEPQASGGSAGIGGGGGIRSGVLGAMLGGSLNKAHMSLDISIIDASTSNVLATKVLQGQASDISGAIMDASSFKWPLSGGLSGYANKPMEKAIRSCLINTVRYTAENIPASYYKY
ncbi:MAG: CsgG/HfaB family protein [Candidatus Omnitrophota bacterium]